MAAGSEVAPRDSTARRAGWPVFTGTVLLPAALLILLWFTTPITPLYGGMDYDGRFYGAMANRDRVAQDWCYQAPWCWRLATPFLASLLPFSPVTDFRALALVSNWLSLALLYLLLRRSEVGPRLALLGMLFFAGVFWSLRFPFYSPCYVDFQTLTVCLAALLLALRGNHRFVPGLLAAGVLQKETVLFMAPVVWVHYGALRGFRTRKSAVYLAALILLPLGVLAAVHLAVRPRNEYAAREALLGNALRMLDPSFWPRLALALVSGLGILPLILLYRFRWVLGFLREQPWWGAQLAMGAILLVGGVDKSRYFQFMLPAVVVTAIRALQPVLERGGIRARAWVGISLLGHLYLGHLLTPMGTVREYIEWLVPEHGTGSPWPGMARDLGVGLLWISATWLLLRNPRVSAARADSAPNSPM